jgi:hypothetical protein
MSVLKPEVVYRLLPTTQEAENTIGVMWRNMRHVWRTFQREIPKLKSRHSKCVGNPVHTPRHLMVTFTITRHVHSKVRTEFTALRLCGQANTCHSFIEQSLKESGSGKTGLTCVKPASTTNSCLGNRPPTHRSKTCIRPVVKRYVSNSIQRKSHIIRQQSC